MRVFIYLLRLGVSYLMEKGKIWIWIEPLWILYLIKLQLVKPQLYKMLINLDRKYQEEEKQSTQILSLLLSKVVTKSKGFCFKQHGFNHCGSSSTRITFFFSQYKERRGFKCFDGNGSSNYCSFCSVSSFVRKSLFLSRIQTRWFLFYWFSSSIASSPSSTLTSANAEETSSNVEPQSESSSSSEKTSGASTGQVVIKWLVGGLGLLSVGIVGW